uniref:Uncharacterized protein n=1 Tax=Nymphaea colorata TaxID=210225 RepID=A0A5K1CTU0_9MAGN
MRRFATARRGMEGRDGATYVSLLAGGRERA